METCQSTLTCNLRLNPPFPCLPADRIGVGSKPEPWFISYMRIFAMTTVLLPLVTIALSPMILGPAAGTFVVEAAGPALMLLFIQLFMESTMSGPGRGFWHAIPRMLNPGAQSEAW